MTTPQPVRYSADLEEIKPDEKQVIADLNETFDVILTRTAEDYGHAVRSVHAKSHGILEGTMTVEDGLTPELAQGLFASPGSYKVYLRLSTNAGDILPDAISLPRGLAMKVVGVQGTRIEDAEGETQDFVMVNGPVFQAPDAKKFHGNLKLLAKTTDRMEGTKKVLSSVLQGVNSALEAVGISSSAVQSLGGAPNIDPLGETYFSVTPFLYGDYVAKFRLKPVAHGLVELTGREIDTSIGDNAIRDTVQAEMRDTAGEWLFQVQLCRYLEKQPIEDPTVEWDEQDAPFITVAKVSAAPQDSWSDDNVRKVDEEMRFSVWTGLAAHRPLGNINRARKDTYQHSSQFRAGFNRCPIHEPQE
ncbi:catalase family protein [Agrobacterium rosae]|uniref:catalase n=1 Tax=Agrobacterium rosae TaxID=1972867 RepID=A0AAE5S0S2_9HYPH|nr:catalase family protein [Agrobacterium rosae]KAA3513127.1 catalase [Agrobacterium rosae]KAA3521384.1 catalase [Agrobacterium rosae]MCM2432766.1 catalase family protein [Agrobacterium rosae]MDX8328164.1 catalase family protein [Agrobacterium rosae]MQB48279.1 catalase [Agrobacterium rosae]